MNDDVDLPLLPPLSEQMHTGGQMLDYARAAVLADRKKRAIRDNERCAKQASPAKPKVYSATLSLGQNGSWSCYPPSIHGECATVTLCWTDDGRAWIESERNRELARRLRVVAEFGYTAPTDAALRDAAAALDGGER